MMSSDDKRNPLIEAPASGNGDVIERAAKAAYEVVRKEHQSATGYKGCEFEELLKAKSYYEDIARAVLQAAGLLKLSEGSGSNRDAMVHVDAACGFLVSIRPRSDTGSAKKQAIESALEQLAGAKLALASVPEGSGDGKMREALATIANSECQNFGTDELRAIAREALATPAPSPIDAEGMRRKNAEISAHLADCTKCGICGELICPCEEGLVPCGKDQCPIQKGDRALPTPAREIDREKIQRRLEELSRQQDFLFLSDWRIEKIAEFLAQGGRHV